MSTAASTDTNAPFGGLRPNVERPGGSEDAWALVEQLYSYADNVFLADAKQKEKTIQTMIDKAVEEIERGKEAMPKAHFYYLKGRALAAAGPYSAPAESCLSKAVKGDPDNADALLALGEVFWKKQDFQSALRCLEDASAKTDHPEPKRLLSMLLRNIPGTPMEMKERVMKSLQFAKDALKQNLEDPMSWYVLGNAYQSLFFRAGHDPSNLSRALAAYQNALGKGGDNNPDLYFNMAHVMSFQEMYPEALASFAKAATIDPSLPAEDMRSSLKRHSLKILDMVKRKGRVKPKRLRELLKSLPSAAKQAVITRSPAAGGRKFVTLGNLQPGENRGTMLLLKLLFPMIRPGTPPATLIMCDSKAESIAVSVYHVDDEVLSRLSSKDVFIILDPMLARVSVPREEGSSQLQEEESKEDANVEASQSFQCIRISDPTSFIVNGRSLSSSTAPAQLQITNLPL